MRVKFIVEGEPVGKQRPRLYRNRIYTPEKTKIYECKVKKAYTDATDHYFEGYTRLTVNAYYSIAKSDSKKKKAMKLSGELRPDKTPDIDNVIKMVDGLNGIAFKDDSCIVEVIGNKYFSDNPRVEFILEDVI